MSVRTSVMLLVALAMLAGYVFFVQLRETSEPAEQPPWFYSIDMADMTRISISHRGEAATFVLAPDARWHFDNEEGLPVGADRWGGITLLLSGPKTRKLLDAQPQPAALEAYGLDIPPTRIEVDLDNGLSIPLLLGDPTPDGVNIYARLEGYPQVYILVASWGAVLTRLISEPPYPSWYYDIDISIMTDVVLTTAEQTVSLKQDEEGWHLGDALLDETQIAPVLAALEQPSSQGITEYRVADMARYGLEEPPLTLYVRTREVREDDIGYINEYVLNFGDLAEDGESYYAQNALRNEETGPPDVYTMDAEWVEALRTIADDPPSP